MTVPITYKQANKQTHNIQIQIVSTKFLITQQAKMQQTLYVLTEASSFCELPRSTLNTSAA